MNTSVSFPIAKLLKEKGYRLLPEFASSYPTIADVVMWIYENYGIWIEVVLERPNQFTYEISRVENQEILNNIYLNYDSLTEAYESAINHVLNNLI